MAVRLLDLVCDGGAPQPARLLSNGRLATVLRADGTGVTTHGDLTLVGWGRERAESEHGLFLYIRDRESGAVWSVARQPVACEPVHYAVACKPGSLSIERHDDGIEAILDVCVAADADVEIRRLKLTNRSDRAREIELTTFAEVVLTQAPAQAAHPAFVKLFVQTAYAKEQQALLAERRPRSRDERHPVLVQALLGRGRQTHESDRARFLGRGRSAAAPAALKGGAHALSGMVGSVLDPAFALRRVARLRPGASQTFVSLLALADTRDSALESLGRLTPRGAVGAAFRAAAARQREVLKRLGVSAKKADFYDALAAAMLRGDRSLRAPAAAVGRADGGLDTLWPYGIGDGLVVVARIDGRRGLALATEALRLNAYWREKGIVAKIVFLCGEGGPTGAEIEGVIQSSALGAPVDTKVLSRTEITPALADLVVARADVLAEAGRDAAGDARAAAASAPRAGARAATAGDGSSGSSSGNSGSAPETAGGDSHARPDRLQSPNGIGGFSSDGSEYVIELRRNAAGELERPPLPWCNVIANEHFGFIASECGTGLVWSRNSHENRLTPWHNDPISDPLGEALYVRDEDAGVFWSPLPSPTPPPADFEVRHGFGYTTWRHTSFDLEQSVTMLVPHDPAESVKVTRIEIVNRSDRPRRLSLVSFTRLVLGPTPEGSSRFVVTEHDAESGALLARNRTNFEFRDGIVFAAAVGPAAGSSAVHFSGDRSAFLGCADSSRGSLAAPAALTQAAELDDRAGPGLDPCAALQVQVEIEPHARIECAFLLGETTDLAAARTLIASYRRPDAAAQALERARGFWRSLLSVVQVETPSPAIDLMVNGWLGYQVLSCRIWGRSAYYQSGGALGFRDQLQDAAALVHLRPALPREQILVHAASQFVEGDVMHWWHPPTGRGIRTRFSDDLLWLPLLTAEYVHATGDTTVLDEQVDFLTGRELNPGEDEAYFVPGHADAPADVYTHCCRALDRGLTRGAHGLPLMGTGDWNDGMNRVGREGRGESVWVGFFLYRIIDEFVPLCEKRGDTERARRYRDYQTALRDALEESAWDGAWYRRAYYDDGTPLGSASSNECRIDALAQSWSVISKAAPPERAEQAMRAAHELLVSEKEGLIRLLTPPFDKDPQDPGYIKGYLPGIRENGGQYTHGATWIVKAWAEMGRRDLAARLLTMLSPVTRASAQNLAIFRVEPYVVVADVYGADPHVGRGGWTWYTGSAGWMLRVAIESVLGVQVEGGDTLVVRPCVPDEWPGFTARVQIPASGATYEVAVRNPSGSTARVVSATSDGNAVAIEEGAARIPLARDAGVHRVEVVLGR